MPFSATHPDFLPAAERFFTHRDALDNAREYEGRRRTDSLKLHTQLVFRPYPHGTMLCTLLPMAHTIRIATRMGGVRASGPAGTGDFMPNGENKVYLFQDLVQVVAFILATNW